MNILDTLRDRQLLGASLALRDLDSWRPWLAFLGAVYGLPLGPDGEALFRRCTGRSVYAPPEGGWREVACVVGRQAGKTRVGALVVAFEAAFAAPCRDGELYALLLAQDQRAALRASLSYIRALLNAAPMLQREIVRETQDTLDLRSGVRIGAYPCRPASVRGLRARVVVLDELAFFRSSEGFPLDVETLRAVRPCLATTNGRLVVLSSPYAQAGALWELHRRHYGRDDSPVLVWQADASTMNPTLSRNYLARMREDDPEAYRSEVLGEFRAGLATLFDADALEAVVIAGRRELPPQSSAAYSAFTDPSGGRGDAFTLAIAHGEGLGAGARVVVDALRAWAPPFDPAQVIAEAASILQRYRVSRVTGDRYSAEFVVSEFRRHGIEYESSAKDRSALYLELLASVNAGRVELLDVPELLRELRTLERRTSTGGRDRVDHARGAHDDRANAVAGVVSLLATAKARRLVRRATIGGEERVVDAMTGALVDEVRGFGRAFDSAWDFERDEDEREPAYVSPEEWLRLAPPPVRSAGS